jgi:hypothetical protein
LKTKKNESGLLYFKENHTDDTVAWTIDATKKIEQYKLSLIGKFKLTSSFTLSDMNLFDANSRIAKLLKKKNLDAFYEMRLEFYLKR